MGTETALAALSTISHFSQKRFATTNDWSPINAEANVEVYTVTLGDIGRSGSERIARTNADIAALIPQLEKYIESGNLKPMDYDILEGADFEPVLRGLDAFGSRKSEGKKLVVRVATE